MSVGVGFLGRQIDFTLGGATLAGIVSKSLSINNSAVDTSDDDSNGWAESLATPGRKEITIGLSLKAKNLSLIQSAIDNTSQIYASLLTFPDGTSTPSTLAGDVFMTTVSLSGEHEDLTTIDVELMYSGEPTFTAAT
ncbi:MAG: phage tail tube protein [Cyanophyceae cyanobacterium]